MVVNFDRVAKPYRWLETIVFGGQLQAVRCVFVRQIPERKIALLVGEGDGRFLEELRRAQPDLQIDCLDASAKMLALARSRVGDEKVQFLQTDVRAVTLPKARYDLVVTHFFLDCFDAIELSEVVQKLAAAATEEAIWLIADFHEPARGWRRCWGRLLIATMYLFFRFAAGLKVRCLVDYAPLLRAEGFALTNEIVAPNEMISSQKWVRPARRPDRSSPSSRR